jgi:hypothetical protein
MRLPRNISGEALIHSPLRVDTPNSILNDVANHLSMEKNDLLRQLFG